MLAYIATYFGCATRADMLSNTSVLVKSASDINTEKLATKDEVKAEVERIDKILTQLTSHLQSIEICGELSSNSINLSTSSPPPLSSTKNNVEHLANEQPSVVMQNSSLQLYISNIANDVTEDEIGSMVCEALGAERVLNVKCLVSPWKDISTLDYVSFKVVVGAQYRKAAFAASNWPTGVRIREFRDRYNSVWRPNRTTQLPE